MIDDQIMLHKKSQEKGFPHEKSNLELNYKILETRRSKYLKDKQKVSSSVLIILKGNRKKLEHEIWKLLIFKWFEFYA